ncbi:hypothetical protein HAX54_004479 [Datura stramonium]|uniref:Aminotransferase-like plant mobile domain-containing protein n=1 Tax=Datura stramonium TaxID=4076 RepID=A0ABS8WVA5_DATST|nr:hypothetical protein [Datura stramonium]
MEGGTTKAPHHRYTNIASPLPSLGHRIVRGDIRWGEIVVFEGEYHHIPGYWEWTEDTLGRSQEVLVTTDIYDAVYASLFTYNRNSDILGSFYEEVIPDATELTCVDAKDQRYIPRFCVSAYDNRSASLDKGLRYWRICVLHRSMSHATFPPVTPDVKKLFADDYMTWWSKTHGNFLDNYFQILVDAPGPISTKISEGESTSSHKDRCWKKVRSSNKSGDEELVVLEIPDNIDSPSRTLTVPFKEESGEFVSSPNPIKLSSAGKIEKEETSICHDGVRARPSSNLHKHPTAAVSVFDGKKVRSTLHDKDMEATRKELSITARERLSNSMFEEHDKIEKVSFIRQSLREVREEIEKLRQKEKDLKVLLEATEKEIEEAKLGVSTIEKDFDACNDANLLNDDDLTDLEQKRERLEALRQYLINYKLCLD